MKEILCGFLTNSFDLICDKPAERILLGNALCSFHASVVITNTKKAVMKRQLANPEITRPKFGSMPDQIYDNHKGKWTNRGSYADFKK